MTAPDGPPRQDVDALFERLDDVTYYQVLGVGALADYVAIKDAYHACAQAYHPDRFLFCGDEGRKARAYAVFKRITEAYSVLSDPVLRRRYDAARAEGAVRLPPHERGRRLSAEERAVQNGLARVYVRSARAKLSRGDLAGARIDVALALSLDDGPTVVALRDEILRAQVRRVQT